MNKLTIDEVRPIVQAYHNEEITLGKCTELLNELMGGGKSSATDNGFTQFLFDKLSHLKQYYPSIDEFEKHLLSGEVVIPVPDVIKYQKEFEAAQSFPATLKQLSDCWDAIDLLKEYEQWEADLISDNAMWWPNVPKDRISGKTYDKMLELQAKRNQILTGVKPTGK